MTNEQKEQFKAALNAAIERREELLAQRHGIEKELSQQNKAIAALSEILGEPSQLELGLSDTVLLIMRSADRSLTAMEIRDKLREAGYKIDEFANPLASLHQILLRLQAKGEILISKDKAGKKTFMAKRDIKEIAAILDAMQEKYGRKSK